MIEASRSPKVWLFTAHGQKEAADPVRCPPGASWRQTASESELTTRTLRRRSVRPGPIRISGSCSSARASKEEEKGALRGPPQGREQPRCTLRAWSIRLLPRMGTLWPSQAAASLTPKLPRRATHKGACQPARAGRPAPTQVVLLWQHQAVAPAVVLVGTGARGVGQQAHGGAEEEVAACHVRLACSKMGGMEKQ